MLKALLTASTGMDAQQTRIAVIANNIANTNTTGFKASRAEFQDLIYESRDTAGSESVSGTQKPNGLQVGSGVHVVSTQGLFTQGVLEQTSRTLDLAIGGQGFFKVSNPSTGEEFYTRAGSLSLDSTGKLVTQDGFPLSPAVTLTTTASSRSISIDGTISEVIPGQTTPNTQAQAIQIFTFPNESGLESVGRNLLKETASSGSATQNAAGSNGAGNIQSGFLESSNVNIAEELIRMITAQRSYELNGKVISTADQMMQATTQLR